ncbi:MAG: hypothetical protein AAFN77_15955 [Planctomycetota bacterium]
MSTCYLLFRTAEANRLYQSWRDQCAFATEVVTDAPHSWEPPDDAVMLVTHMHYRWEDLSCLRRVFNDNRLPILILADGILEYRNTWEHEGLPDGAMFQPLFGHKIACMGEGQARLIESWGNGGRCEVVGFSAFESIQPLPLRTTPSSQNDFRLMIATANTPSFDEQQHRVLLESLNAIREWADGKTTSDGRRVELDWRLNLQLTQELDLPVVEAEDRPSLHDAISEVDAVITTPSTLYLESCLLGRPTALLDFHNRPQYVPSAWSIGAKSMIGDVVEELANPPAAKLQFQDFSLRDQLQIAESPIQRLVTLVDAMCRHGEMCRNENRNVELPERILKPAATQRGQSPLSLASLYPNNKVFEQQDRQRLQIELTAAVERLKQLPDEVASQGNYILRLLGKNKKLNNRIQNLHQRVVSLRARLGIGPPDSEDEE